MKIRALLSRTRLHAQPSGAPRARRGVALFITMFFVFGIGALALSAIYLTANASLISKTYEKEDDLKYASEAALAIGKAALNFNPAALPNTGFDTLMLNKTLATADAQLINGITVSLYAGPTGSTSGQFGRFASLVAEARDPNGTGFIRRLELTQESFAKYAYWSNHETNGGATIVFANGDQLWGPVWSNDDLTISSTGGAIFHDAVGTAGVINGVGNGTFSKGYQINQRPINLPSLSSLAGLAALATAGGMNLTAPTTGDESTVLERIEFLGIDMDANGDSIGANEGFFRVYKANAGQTNWLRADWPGSSGTLPTIASVRNCGDWHRAPDGKSQFFPVAVHPQAWFKPYITNDTTTAAIATTESAATVTTIMGHPGARCYLGGDPHLVAVERTNLLGYTNAQIQIGGTETTFTPIDQYGRWLVNPATPNAAVTAKRPADASYLYPLYRGFNTSTKGVIYVSGTIGVSGVVRGDITLYTPNTVVFLDDLRYANDPSGGLCVDILGIIAGDNATVADNSMNSPQYTKVSGTPTVKSLDDTPDLYIHSVIMALGTSFQVENYDTGPNDALTCSGVADGRGCLYITGGLIQNNRGIVGKVSGTGYIKRYSYDRCAVVNPPPYFPTTGRFQDNRYYELDPVRFNVTNLYHSLTPGG